MKIVSCHRKYPITTKFLDTMLEHSVAIQEGETKLDAYRRGLKELDQIAAELRREANPHLYQESKTEGRIPLPADYVEVNSVGIYSPNGTIPIISKDVEKLEIAIDNAITLEELAPHKEAIWKAGLTPQYMKKVEQLTLNITK